MGKKTEFENETLDLDGGIEAVEPKQPTQPEAVSVAEEPRDVDGIPYCRRHHCRMVQYSGRTRNNPRAYYRCPVEGCDERQSVIRHGGKAVPSEPTACPECGNRGRVIYLERDNRRSTVSSVVLRCPHCEYSVGPLAMPNQAAVHAFTMRRAGVRDIGER